MPGTVLDTRDTKERPPPQAVQLGGLVARVLAIIQSKGFSPALAASHTHNHPLSLSAFGPLQLVGGEGRKGASKVNENA